MTIGRVYTPPIFSPRGMNHSIGRMGACNEYWKGVHLSNIHHEGYGPLVRGYRGARKILEGF